MAVRDDILKTFEKISDPETGLNLIEANIVSSVIINDENVSVILNVNPSLVSSYEKVKAQMVSATDALRLQKKVNVLFTSHKKNVISQEKPKTIPDLKIGQHPVKQVAKFKPPGVKQIIAVGSGKGGVGKSTISANLALALSKSGCSIGLLDADMYGPSQPLILGTNEKPKSTGSKNKTIIPINRFGIKTMSIGYLVPKNEAIIWRGPMLMGALQQFINQVDWGELDILLIDLPPGTGDVQLTLSQKFELDGAIIVSTPQDIALLDARKAVDMFYRLDIPILGMIENMSTYTCKKCGYSENIFGKNGVEDEAAKKNISFLGKIPLNIELREATDSGQPVALEKDSDANSKIFSDLAKNLLKVLAD